MEGKQKCRWLSDSVWNKPGLKGAKTASIKDSGIRSYTRKDVFKGNTYYVRVRTYKMKDGVKYYSNWSGTKNVNINK